VCKAGLKLRLRLRLGLELADTFKYVFGQTSIRANVLDPRNIAVEIYLLNCITLFLVRLLSNKKYLICYLWYLRTKIA